VLVPPVTRKTQIRSLVAAAVLPGDDMLNVKGVKRNERLRNAAVLAPVSGPLSDMVTNMGVH